MIRIVINNSQKYLPREKHNRSITKHSMA